MKKVLAFLLCASLLFSVLTVNGGAEENPERDAAVTEVMQSISALNTITRESKSALQQVNQKINDFCYDYGFYNDDLILNMRDFDLAVSNYNKLVDYLEGDINSDKKVDAKDALKVLQRSVGKVTLTQKEEYAADVTNDTKFDAKDALMMLQFSVGKRTEFPSHAIEHTPYEKVAYSTVTAKGAALYKATYQSMIDRIRQDGYTQTSLTGAYEGMYLRDASIQIMAHVTQGDFEQARMILNYITEYHRFRNLSYIMYIIRTYNAYHEQPDTTFFFLHAWYLFATQAPKTEANVTYIESSYAKIKEFANYYLDKGNLRSEYDLMYNESFEHSRDGSYWQSYDLVTNVYASQALHELAEYFKTSDPANSQKWQEASTRIANGIHKNLTVEFQGSLMYAEFYGTKKKNIETVPETEKQFFPGFSWVNLAPMGCDWYAADPAILEHTYQTYLEYGSVKYTNPETRNRYKMLEVYTPTAFNVERPRRLTNGNHIIGKGLAWELMYCHKTGKTDRVESITAFIEESSKTFYPEVWAYGGGVNDTGNQEQASWMLVAQKTMHPELNAK